MAAANVAPAWAGAAATAALVSAAAWVGAAVIAAATIVAAKLGSALAAADTMAEASSGLSLTKSAINRAASVGLLTRAIRSASWLTVALTSRWASAAGRMATNRNDIKEIRNFIKLALVYRQKCPLRENSQDMDSEM
jgi:hypothetical protein